MYIDFQRRLNFQSKQEIYDLIEILSFFYLSHKDDLQDLSFDYSMLLSGLNSAYDSYHNFPSYSDIYFR